MIWISAPLSRSEATAGLLAEEGRMAVTSFYELSPSQSEAMPYSSG